MTVLALVRHGQSVWNAENRFTGWSDVGLSDQGREEAWLAGDLLSNLDVQFHQTYASMLKRAIQTLWTILDAMDRQWVPQALSWRLNERHYGALQGLVKDEVAAEHGEDQVMKWRRSFDVAPPLLDDEDHRHPRWDPRFHGLDPNSLPRGESLKDTLERVLPFWESAISAKLRSGSNVLICAHGNSIRALIKHLFNVNGERVAQYEVPTGNPLLIHFIENDLKIAAARYLDPQRGQPLPPLPNF